MEKVKFKTPLWIKILLVISLCLNMIIVGLAVGAAYKWFVFGPVPIHQYFGSVGLGGFSGSLDKIDRDQLRLQLANRKDSMDEILRDAQQEFESLISILSSDSFDKEALDDHFANQRQLSLNRMETAHSLLSTQIANMTPEERAGVAERMQQGFWHGRKGDRFNKHSRGRYKHDKDSDKDRFWKFW